MVSEIFAFGIRYAFGLYLNLITLKVEHEKHSSLVGINCIATLKAKSVSKHYVNLSSSTLLKYKQREFRGLLKAMLEGI